MSTIKRAVLQRFVDEYPDKAVDVLVNSCHYQDINNEIVQFLLDPGQSPKSKPHSAPETMSAHTIPQPQTSYSSQRPASVSGHHQQPIYNHPHSGTHAEPMSPPASIGKSLTSKDGKENIAIIATNENDDIKEHIATMRPVPLDHSIIGDNMFSHGRICGSNKEEIDEQQILVPTKGVSGNFRQVFVSHRAELTWKRAKPHASNSTTFYVVPQEFLDIDVLLGSLQSGLEWSDTMPSQPRLGQRLTFNEHAPSAHSDNFPRDAHHRSNSNNGFSHTNRIQPNERIREYVISQGEHAASSRGLSTATPDPRHVSSGNYRPTTAETVSSTQASTDTIRVSCTVGSSTISFWLDLSGSAEAFFDTVCPKLEKKNGPFDRTIALVLFARDKGTGDDGGHELCLGEDELDADWEGTVAWLRDNKNAKPPHMYATVQFDGG